MRQVVIENPVINSPFDEPQRQFRFGEEGITNEIVEDRRVSQYFVPIARPRKKDTEQLQFDTECVRLKDHTFPQLLLLIEFAHDAADPWDAENLIRKVIRR